MASQKTEKLLQNSYRLYGNVHPRPHHNSCHFRHLDICGNSDKPDWQYEPFCANGKDHIGHNTICTYVCNIHSTVCVHAKYKSKVEMRGMAWNIGWCGNARSSALLYTFTNMGKQLQRHIRLVCSITAFHAMGTDLMVNLPFRSRIVLYESKP